MEPLQNDIWARLGHVPDLTAAAAVPAPAGPDTPAVPTEPAPAGGPSETSEQRSAPDGRRRFDRGGRRRADWPEDAGMSGCPGCGHETIQSLGTLDSGDYLWQCPQCDRRFQTGRASRAML
jgi:hypothetical protein